MTQPVKHTPGPWHVGLKPGPMVYGPQGEQIVGLNVLLDSNEVLANAKFIAAAPEMYGDIATLVEVEGTITIHDGIACLPDGTTINLQATKAKAEGR